MVRIREHTPTNIDINFCYANITAIYMTVYEQVPHYTGTAWQQRNTHYKHPLLTNHALAELDVHDGWPG